MIFSVKKPLALFVVTLLLALQAHSALHLLERSRHDNAEPGRACEACVQSLQQVGLAVLGPVTPPSPQHFFAPFFSAILSLQPRFYNPSPALRAPPAFS